MVLKNPRLKAAAGEIYEERSDSSPLGICTKSDFITLLEDCCRNFVVEHPERRDEFMRRALRTACR